MPPFALPYRNSPLLIRSRPERPEVFGVHLNQLLLRSHSRETALNQLQYSSLITSSSQRPRLQSQTSRCNRPLLFLPNLPPRNLPLQEKICLSNQRINTLSPRINKHLHLRSYYLHPLYVTNSSIHPTSQLLHSHSPILF